jgi:phenylpropionate dioxygenase-like ring-hydroxylating dioxygenase large terminal subunit
MIGTNGSSGSMKSLVDLVEGEISREIFVNKDIYQQEKERVFARAWLYVGHESQVKKPGDFFLSRMGEEQVILTRDQSGTIRVFLNSCRHRGMKVCRYDEGHTTAFYCPYHGWSYGLDGELVAVQAYEKSYTPPFPKEGWGLVEVAKIANLRGTIWATWDPKAPSFDDYLGEAKEGLDVGMRAWDGGDSGTELLGSPQKWIVPSNWKFVAENFAGDMLHAVSHRSVEMVGIGPGQDKGRRDNPGKVMLSAYPHGHGFFYGLKDVKVPRNDYAISPITAEYFQDCWRRRIELMGDRAGVCPVLGTVFPNMSFHAQQPRTILVSHPRGPNLTEMWRVYFVDKEAPQEARDFLRRYYMRYSGPGGMTEQDDMENWSYASEASEGLIARRYPYHYKSGLNSGAKHPIVPGLVTDEPVTSEQNPRMLYRRWAEYMDAKSWDELQNPQVTRV